jgi:hypothetical protein
MSIVALPWVFAGVALGLADEPSPGAIEKTRKRSQDDADQTQRPTLTADLRREIDALPLDGVRSHVFDTVASLRSFPRDKQKRAKESGRETH